MLLVLALAASASCMLASTGARAQSPPLLVEYVSHEAQLEGNITGAQPALSRQASVALEAIRADPAVLAVRHGRAAPAPIVHTRSVSIALPDTAETLTFKDLDVEALDSGYGLFSRERDAPTSITLVVMGQDVIGTLRHRGALYEVRPLGGGLTAVYRYDASRLRAPEGEDFVVPDGPFPESAPSTRGGAPPAARDEIDVLIVYTRAAKRSVGNMDAAIALLVLETHLKYANSAITTRLRVVHAYETSIPVASEDTPPNTLEDLNRLSAPDDGFLDDALEAREQFHADVVVLLYRPSSGLCGGGIAFLLSHQSWSAEHAFAVVGMGGCNSVSASSFAHEVGHLQGGAHDPESRGGEPYGPYRHGHGFCNAERGWRTVMAYNTDGRCREEIAHFSSAEVLYEGQPTGDRELRNVARVINETAHAVANFRSRTDAPARRTHRLPFVPGADTPAMIGLVRVHNRSEVDGEVEIHAVDDTGERFGPLNFPLLAGHIRGFNSHDLERGNAARGLDGGVGDGEGDWRLELATALDIEARAYIRTSEGFLTSMHQLAREHESIAGHYVVPFFNPASNTSIRSSLRVANPGPATAYVTVEAWDSDGVAASEAVEFSLGAGAALTLSAQALEAGDDAQRVTGRFGDGAGKWRLEVSSAHGQALEVMSLLRTRSGHLTNLSR